jgi:hypothetical protein
MFGISDDVMNCSLCRVFKLLLKLVKELDRHAFFFVFVFVFFFVLLLLPEQDHLIQ